MYTSETAFRRALEHRLLNRARETGMPLLRLRREAVFEALLVRLQAVSPDGWLLKGGLAMELRVGISARTTRDMDLARYDSEDQATSDFVAAQELRVEDHFEFSIERTGRSGETGAVRSVEYRVRAEVAGVLFESVHVDVGFGDPKPDVADLLSTPGLLSFAGIEPVQVPTIPVEQHLAEKVHAYTRVYASGASSRVKDLVDMALIATHEAPSAGRLQQALDATFHQRSTHDLPPRLSPPPASWATPYARLAATTNLDTHLEVGFNLATSLIDPILERAIPGGARWDHQDGVWGIALDNTTR